jgi:hypothetical protein
MPPNDPLDAYLTAMADTLGLRIESDWRPAIRTHLGITLGMVRLVEGFDLPDEAEPAPSFRA